MNFFAEKGVGRAVERGGRADRGGDAGEGEGGEAAGGVRRPRVEAQAAGHRRRRLLGDLPLLPLAAVVAGARARHVDVPDQSTSTKRKYESRHYEHRARRVRGRECSCRRPRFRTCISSHDRDTARFRLAAGGWQNKKKISGFHTGLSRCARTKLSHQKRGEKMHFVLIFSVWLWIPVVMANSRDYRYTSIAIWSQITCLATSAHQIGILDLQQFSTMHYWHVMEHPSSPTVWFDVQQAQWKFNRWYLWGWSLN